MAPERVQDSIYSLVTDPSKGGDIYSFAMTSFSVRTSFRIHHTTWNNRPVTVRSSRGYCPITEAIYRKWSTIFVRVNDHLAQ